MKKANIENLLSVLGTAMQQGCKNVTLQLYDNWDDIAREQQHPTHQPEDYKIDTRYFNTIEFEPELKDNCETENLLWKVDGQTLVIRTTLTDRDTLIKGLGLDDFAN